MGVAKNVSAFKASQLLNSSGVDLLLTDLLSTKIEGRCFFFPSPKCFNFLNLQVVILS